MIKKFAFAVLISVWFFSTGCVALPAKEKLAPINADARQAGDETEKKIGLLEYWEVQKEEKCVPTYMGAPACESGWIPARADGFYKSIDIRKITSAYSNITLVRVLRDHSLVREGSSYFVINRPKTSYSFLTNDEKVSGLSYENGRTLLSTGGMSKEEVFTRFPPGYDYFIRLRKVDETNSYPGLWGCLSGMTLTLLPYVDRGRSHVYFLDIMDDKGNVFDSISNSIQYCARFIWLPLIITWGYFNSPCEDVTVDRKMVDNLIMAFEARFKNVHEAPKRK